MSVWIYRYGGLYKHKEMIRMENEAERDPDIVRRIETRELIATVRRVAKEQPLYRSETILHLNLAAAELERLAYPSG